VPCDSMKAGSFVDIVVTIDDGSKTGCGWRNVACISKIVEFDDCESAF